MSPDDWWKVWNFSGPDEGSEQARSDGSDCDPRRIRKLTAEKGSDGRERGFVGQAHQTWKHFIFWGCVGPLMDELMIPYYYLLVSQLGVSTWDDVRERGLTAGKYLVRYLR